MIRAIFFISLFTLSPQAWSADWSQHALRLTGESDEVRTQSLQQLRKIPELEKILRGELGGPNRYLALDVIAALPLPKMFDDVLRAAERDETGFFYNALNSLVTMKNRRRIATVYAERATTDRTPPPARIVLLDTLTRLGVLLPAAQLRPLLTQTSFEVRSATLAYARHFLLHARPKDYLPLVLQAAGNGPYQIRIQALSLLSELARAARPGSPEMQVSARLAPLLLACQRDGQPEIQKFCASLMGPIGRIGRNR